MHENPLKRKISDLTPGEQDAIKSLLDTLGIENTLSTALLTLLGRLVPNLSP